MSGLRVILTDAPIPESSVVECVLDLRKATFRYERDAKEPRKLRAVGGSNWIAQADHQSRLYRFEYGGRAWRFDPSLSSIPDAARAYIQIVPDAEVLPVFSATYGTESEGLCLIHWVTGVKTRWYTEGLGIWYGVGVDLSLHHLLFQRT